MLQGRLAKVKDELRDVELSRGLQRLARQRQQVPTVALVGYTNAGKSTLFNRMVDAGTLVADALFATLDPLMRKLELEGGLEVVLVDTVGFIADLPHELVEAFKATLEEVVMADVLLHIHDVSNPEMVAQAADVQAVLGQIGAADKQVVEVYNKVDRTEMPVPVGGFGVSAVTGQGVEELLGEVGQRLRSDWVGLEVDVPAGDGKKLAWLYAHGNVVTKALEGETWHLSVKMRGSDVAVWRRLESGE
jgi:GTP-binding protein HflX